MATTDTTTFDVAALKRGIEERDAQTLTALFAEDGELSVVDGEHPPSRPTVVRGRQEIGTYYADVCGRDMEHRLERVLVNGDQAAFVQECRYPTGERVTCIAALDLEGGRIVRLNGIQAWDA
jgi:ketosteroid isomerase-like protein